MLEKLKKRLHRHKWHEYTRGHPSANIIFYCRECACGAKQIQHKNGSIMPSEWVDLDDMKWRFDWEKEWFDNSIKQQKV